MLLDEQQRFGHAFQLHDFQLLVIGSAFAAADFGFNKDVLKGVIPEKILNNLSNIIEGKEIDLGEYLSKIRLIPFMSLGKENGMLIGIKADGLTVNTQEDVVFIKNIIIGIYDGSLSKTGKYKALIGLELLENKGGNEENEHIRTVKI